MKENYFNEVLAASMQAIESGRMTPTESLEHYPEYRDELVAYFGLASRLRRVDTPPPREKFRFAARAHILNQIAQHEPGSATVTFFDQIRLQ